LFDNTFYFYSLDNDTDIFRDRVVTVGRFEVVNGHFSGTLVVPAIPESPLPTVAAAASGETVGLATGGAPGDLTSPESPPDAVSGGAVVTPIGERGFITVRAIAYGPGFRQTFINGDEKFVSVEGSAESQDKDGPDVDIYLGNRSFRDGDQADLNPDLLVDLRDDSGILVARNLETIGDDEHVFRPLTLKIDDQPYRTDLGYYYQPSLDDYRAGTIERKIALGEGEHTLTVTAYDSVGNRTDKTVHCAVSGGLALVEVMNCPNPFKDDTYFTFQATTDIDSLVIKVYTVTGRLIRKLEAGGLTAGFHRIRWDGRDRAGDAIANGVYFYTITARAGDQKVVVRDKLVKLR
jgi:hypothetical protein